MQEENIHRKSLLDTMTRKVIHRSSRRGLLSQLGKKGLVVASVMGLTGIGLGEGVPAAKASAHSVAQVSVAFDHTFEPDPLNLSCVQSPPPCFGGCVFACTGHTSFCTTGGARCIIHFSGSCNGSLGQASGGFDCLGHFHCGSQPC